MLFWKKKTPPLVQSSASAWREQWRAIVPPECRNVPVTVGVPGTPAELANWLRGGFMSGDL